mgnify:CR=1 FL=1
MKPVTKKSYWFHGFLRALPTELPRNSTQGGTRTRDLVLKMQIEVIAV